ncbi:MAG: hypothetical protein ACI93R_001629 [Flavobacteriales bacterium]|jgi:hypothetical protein
MSSVAATRRKLNGVYINRYLCFSAPTMSIVTVSTRAVTRV